MRRGGQDFPPWLPHCGCSARPKRRRKEDVEERKMTDRREGALCALEECHEEDGEITAGRATIIEFSLFPSKAVRLKQKTITWLGKFQKLPSVSPYEDSSGLHPNSPTAEKRLAGVLHKLLSLFVDNSAERRKFLCLRKYLGLSQKFYKALEHHTHIFYLLLKGKTCIVILKEAYCGGAASAIEKHPVLYVRKKYVKLMKKSEIILRE